MTPRHLIAGAAIAAAALIATGGVASAHEAEPVCTDDGYTVVATTSEPGFTWADNGDGTWTATWGDGFTVTGDAPEECPTPATTTTTAPTTVPSTTSPAEPTTTTTTPPVVSTSTAPGTTAPPETSTPPAGPGAPPSSVASSTRAALPATGDDTTLTLVVVGIILAALGALVVGYTRRRAQ
jgi:LPXTG-motif cell wall-anchored protein